MRPLALSILLILAAACEHSSPNETVPVPEASAGPALPLRLDLSYHAGENSRDSHTYSHRCTIEDGRLTYSGPVDPCPRGQCKEQEVTFAITAAQVRKLLDVIEEKGLFEEYVEERDTNLQGSYEQLSLEVSDGERKGSIRVAGMQKAWGLDDEAPKDEPHGLSDEARRRMLAANALHEAITELVRPHMPDGR